MSLFKRSVDSAPPITSDRVREVIRAGVGAQRLVEMTERAYQTLETVSNEQDRRKRAQEIATEAMLSPIHSPGIDSELEHQTDRYTDWIDAMRCPSCAKEGFLARAWHHGAASFTVAAFWFGILIIVGIWTKTHPDNQTARAAEDAARQATSMAFPEVGEQPAGSQSTGSLPHGPGSSATTNGH